MKPISSETTGLLQRAGAQQNGTGQPLGAPGSETPSSGALTVQHPELTRLDPQGNMDRALSRLRDFGCSATWKVVDSKFKGEEWTPVEQIVVTLSDAADLPEITKICDSLSLPADDKQVVAWLTELSVMTARRSTDETEATLTIAAYGKRLRKYPGDVVRQALEDWPDRSKWWPTWNELQQVLDGHNKRRSTVVENVRRRASERLSLQAKE